MNGIGIQGQLIGANSLIQEIRMAQSEQTRQSSEQALGVGPLSIVPHPMRNRPPVVRMNPPKVNAVVKRLDPIEEVPAPSSLANGVSPQNKRLLNVVQSRAPLPNL